MVGVRAKDHDEKRKIILDQAAQLFGAQGFHKTSIAQISKASGGSKAWIFHYFPNKESILFTLLKDFIEMFHDRISAAISRGDTPRARLREYVRESILIYEQYRINYPILFNDMKLLPLSDQKILKAVERENAQILSNVIVAINPNIKQTDMLISPITFMVFGAINWTYIWYDPDGPLAIDRLVQLMETFLVEGVQAI